MWVQRQDAPVSEDPKRFLRVLQPAGPTSDLILGHTSPSAPDAEDLGRASGPSVVAPIDAGEMPATERGEVPAQAGQPLRAGWVLRQAARAAGPEFVEQRPSVHVVPMSVRPVNTARVPGTENPGLPPAPPPSVHVTIGRIEVRESTAAANPKREARPAQAVMTLEEYLRRRARGGGP
jgi:hypothetical protein